MMYINEEMLFTPLSESVKINDRSIEFKIPGVFDKRNKYMAEYNASHQLIKIYKQSGNIDGVKHELCKLWYIYLSIQVDLKHKKNKDYALRANGYVAQEFKESLEYVLKKEPNFDFGKYFKESDYYDQTINLTPENVSLIKKMLKTIIN